MKYVYNDFGQLITEYQQDTDGDGTWNLIQSRTSNKVNEITDITETVGNSWVTPAYNKSGNMTTIPIPTDPTTSYTATYDAWNRLVKLEDDTNTITKYQYDGLRRRIIHKVYNTGVLDHTKHLYYNANWQLLEERGDSNTSPTKQQIWGNRYIDDLVIRDHDTNNDGTLNERLYALQDANWNVTSYINKNGTIQERYIYNAYGSVTFLDNNFNVISNSTIEPDHLYAGYNYDADVEMYHVRNRVYHPLLGTWLQRDPIGYDGGINLYEYAKSSPILYLDSSGQVVPIIVYGGAKVLLPVVGAYVVLSTAVLLSRPASISISFPNSICRRRRRHHSDCLVKHRGKWKPCPSGREKTPYNLAQNRVRASCPNSLMMNVGYCTPVPNVIPKCGSAGGIQYHCFLTINGVSIDQQYRVSIRCCNCCSKKSESTYCGGDHWSMGKLPPGCI